MTTYSARTYSARIGEDNISTMTDPASAIGCASLLDHVASAEESPDAGTIVFDESVARVLRDLPSDYDGHFDGEAIWVGGTDYPVVAS